MIVLASSLPTTCMYAVFLKTYPHTLTPSHPHSHTLTPSHPHTLTHTPSHPHTFTPSHLHTFTPSHPHTLTPSHPHSHPQKRQEMKEIMRKQRHSYSYTDTRTILASDRTRRVMMEGGGTGRGSRKRKNLSEIFNIGEGTYERVCVSV